MPDFITPELRIYFGLFVEKWSISVLLVWCSFCLVALTATLYNPLSVAQVDIQFRVVLTALCFLGSLKLQLVSPHKIISLSSLSSCLNIFLRL